MARNLNDMLAFRPQDSQHRIAEMADEMLLEVKFQAIREELGLTQAELARNMGLLQKNRSDPIYSYSPKGWVDNGQSRI